MIKNALEYIVSAVASLKPKRDNPHRDIFGRVIEHGEEFFHPQSFKGIPVFDTESIMRHYKPILDKLRLHTDLGDHRTTPDGKKNLFDALYTDIIRRYVEFAHMIPASEDHHHAHTGGLILHSLEVSISSLRYAKEFEIPKTGFLDIDQQLKPIMHYCAWLGGLLHDAGKLMIDISVDAAEIIHPLTRKPIPLTGNIPSWRPQKESLTEWAMRYNIASYSVSFYNDRIHKRHNVDSAQILPPLLHNTYALDYILTSPLNNETYSELCRVLSGYTKSKDFLSSAIRKGDAHSTGENLGIAYDSIRGNRTLSTASRIHHAIRNARKQWDWNVQNAEGWIIGGEVYLRWTSAIDSIAKSAKEMQYALPTDVRNLLTIMESNGLVQMYSKENRMIKFSPGGFKPSDIPLISSGQRNIQWIDLFKMRGREMVFGSDPMPDSIAGLIFLSESRSFIIIDKDGIATEFDGETGELEKTANTLPASVTQAPSAPALQTNDLPTGPVVKKQNPTATPKPAPIEKEEPTSQPDKAKTTAKVLQLLPTQSTITNQEAIELAFTSNNDNPPAKPEKTTEADTPKSKDATDADTSKPQEQTGQVKEKSTKKTNSRAPKNNVEQDNDTLKINAIESNNGSAAPEDNSQRKPKRCSPVLSSLLDAKVIYHKVGMKILIDAADAQIKTSLSLKEIVSDLESHNHLAINLMNPNQKLEVVTSNNEQVKAIPLSQSIAPYFKYDFNEKLDIEVNHDDKPNSANNHDDMSNTASKQDVKTPAQHKKSKSEKLTNDSVNSASTSSNLDSESKDKQGVLKGTSTPESKNDAEVTPTTNSSPSQKVSKAEAHSIIEKLSHSDAFYFVRSGHPHVSIEGACKALGKSQDELLALLSAAKLLEVDISRAPGAIIEMMDHEGTRVETVLLRKTYARYFSSHEDHKPTSQSEVLKGQAPEATPEIAYSLDVLLSKAPAGSLLKFLHRFDDPKRSFLIAEADHVKIETKRAIHELTMRRSEFSTSISLIKSVFRVNATRIEEIGGTSFACIPNDKLLSILLSEI